MGHAHWRELDPTRIGDWVWLGVGQSVVHLVHNADVRTYGSTLSLCGVPAHTYEQPIKPLCQHCTLMVEKARPNEGTAGRSSRSLTEERE